LDTRDTAFISYWNFRRNYGYFHE